jgi:ketosteroid isomerase-like protein
MSDIGIERHVRANGNCAKRDRKEHMTQQSEKDDVITLEARRCEATSRADLQALQEILADDYLHVTGNGSIMNKADYLAWVRQLPRSHQRGDLTVRIYGDTAVLVGGLLNRLQEKAGVRIIETVVTQVARKDGKQWRFVSFHITPKSSPIH